MPHSATPAPPPTPTPTPAPVSGRPHRHHVPAAAPRRALAVGSALLLAPLLTGLLLRVDQRPFFQGIDDVWAGSANGSSAGAATAFALALDRLGGPLGLILPLMLTGCLCVYGRWRSALFVLATAIVADIVVVLPLKAVADRPRPPHPWVLVNDGSYPSGQVFSTVALVIAVAVVAMPPTARRWWWLFGGGYTAAMMWSRTWLHAQWLTDTFGGALAGAGACLLLWRVFARLLETEAERAAANTLWL
ncbi:phosphatase PAP2 family protein [Streptomyces sp. NPDC002138]|uniref:phosphatase PAP2 family protein n=1 Tax=Streptomyces sp. NPDC002138 TaxID=3154410 RepID=UPI00332676AD